MIYFKQILLILIEILINVVFYIWILNKTAITSAYCRSHVVFLTAVVILPDILILPSVFFYTIKWNNYLFTVNIITIGYVDIRTTSRALQSTYNLGITNNCCTRAKRIVRTMLAFLKFAEYQHLETKQISFDWLLLIEK